MQRKILTISVPAMRVYRVQQGMGIRGLAKRTGVTASTLGRIERGESVPRLDTAEKIAAALGKSLVDVWELRF